MRNKWEFIGSIIKVAVSAVVYVLSFFIISFMYDRKYCTGRYFKYGGVGHFWVLSCFWGQLFTIRNRRVPWPVSPCVLIANYKNIHFDPNDMTMFHMSGNYYQAIYGHIYIGSGTWIAPGVGVITTNHDVHNLDEHVEGKDVVIGKKCWIGMNAVILPGVILGDCTIVGAGSVVTKSFPEGKCIVAGNPARKLRDL